MSAFKDLFKSKKFWLTIIGSAVVGGLQISGVSGEIVTLIASLFGLNIASQGLADFGKHKNPPVDPT